MAVSNRVLAFMLLVIVGLFCHGVTASSLSKLAPNIFPLTNGIPVGATEIYIRGRQLDGGTVQLSGDASTPASKCDVSASTYSFIRCTLSGLKNDVPAEGLSLFATVTKSCGGQSCQDKQQIAVVMPEPFIDSLDTDDLPGYSSTDNLIVISGGGLTLDESSLDSVEVVVGGTAMKDGTVTCSVVKLSSRQISCMIPTGSLKVSSTSTTITAAVVRKLTAKAVECKECPGQVGRVEFFPKTVARFSPVGIVYPAPKIVANNRGIGASSSILVIYGSGFSTGSNPATASTLRVKLDGAGAGNLRECPVVLNVTTKSLICGGLHGKLVGAERGLTIQAQVIRRSADGDEEKSSKITVATVYPTASINDPITYTPRLSHVIKEGEELKVAFSFQTGSQNQSLIFDWGDGIVNKVNNLDEQSARKWASESLLEERSGINVRTTYSRDANMRHKYLDNPSGGRGKFSLNITLVDEGLSSVSRTVEVSVEDVPPRWVSFAPHPSQYGKMVGEFYDPGLNDIFRVKVYRDTEVTDIIEHAQMSHDPPRHMVTFDESTSPRFAIEVIDVEGASHKVSEALIDCKSLGTCCGNGLLDEGEDCDPLFDKENDCCTEDCTFATFGSRCEDGLGCSTQEYCNGRGTCLSGPCCGDGFVDFPTEECDAGMDPFKLPCCTSTCKLPEESHTCGEDISCLSGGHCYAGHCVAVNDCPNCGNGVVEGLEECDIASSDVDSCCTGVCSIATKWTPCSHGGSSLTRAEVEQVISYGYCNGEEPACPVDGVPGKPGEDSAASARLPSCISILVPFLVLVVRPPML